MKCISCYREIKEDSGLSVCVDCKKKINSSIKCKVCNEGNEGLNKSAFPFECKCKVKFNF